MTQGIHQLTAGMVNQLNRVDTISNNLANQNTVGFKQDHLAEGSFNNYLKKAHEKKEEINPLSEIMNTIPKIDTKYLDGSMGSITATGNKLDFALGDNNAFFKVKDENNNILYTRDGSFKSLDGKLVTQNGYEVLNNNNQSIQIDDANNFVANISIVKTDFTNLDKIGNNNYKALDNNKITNHENNEETLFQGSVERSNVNTIKSMVTLIEAQRKFEQSQKAISGIDEINRKVIADVGTTR